MSLKFNFTRGRVIKHCMSHHHTNINDTTISQKGRSFLYECEVNLITENGHVIHILTMLGRILMSYVCTTPQGF